MADIDSGRESSGELEMLSADNSDQALIANEALLSQCREQEQDDVKTQENETEHVNPSIDITPEQDGGVMKQIITPGTGDTPGFGDKVVINFTGFVHVGKSLKEFDRSHEKFQFHLGRGLVIRGLEIGLTTMKRNEQSVFIIQPQYGYGELGNPPAIPPMSVLFFVIELFEWKLEDLSVKKDDGILRKVILKGEGLSSPNDGAVVKAEIIGSYNDKIFESREVEFILGEGCNFEIPEGIEIALLKFKMQEKSMLYLKAKYAFNSSGKSEYGIPPDADVQYEITLHSFKKVKDVWEMNSDEKYERAEEAKVKGSSYFEAGNYRIALKQFKKIITYLENEPGVSPDSEMPRKSLLVAGYLNMTLCLIKLENFIDAIKACDKTLSIEPESEKALFRRGQSRMAINDCDQALEDFQKLATINPCNKACKNSIVVCQMKINQQKEKEKSIYGDMFKKFAEQDEEERKRRSTRTETGVWDEKKHNSKHGDETIVKMLNIKHS